MLNLQDSLCDRTGASMASLELIVMISCNSFFLKIHWIFFVRNEVHFQLSTLRYNLDGSFKASNKLSSVVALSTKCNNKKMYLSVNSVDSAMLFMILLKDLPAINGCVHMFLYQPVWTTEEKAGFIYLILRISWLILKSRP